MKDIKILVYIFRTQVKRSNLKGKHHARNPWF
jgi:hypothetical protein